MSALHFGWDPVKAAANLRKHGVSFEEAETAFSDENGLLMADPAHSDAEPRFISARKATKAERGQYVARWEP